MSSITTPPSAGKSRSDLEELQDHGLIGTEQIAVGDSEQEAVADLAGRAGNGDAHWLLHEVGS